MDGNRFDAISRNLALATDRRSIMRGTAGGGFLALVGMLFGRSRRVEAKEPPVTCVWQIEAHGSAGPNKSRSYNGILTATIEPDGAIDDGTYVLVDGAWNPLLDSDGDPIWFDVVGSSHLRSIDFRIEHDGCHELAFTGVNRFHVRDCKGPMSGSFQGPELVDLGGWRTRRTDFCPPCRGTVCPPETYLDGDTCECLPECPDNSRICKDLVCVPECPDGYVYDKQLCICACKPKKCKKGEVWCPHVCDCVPPDPCEEFKCPPGYVHYLVDDGICICVKEPCGKEIVCPPGKLLIFNGEECRCIGKDPCEEQKCDEGYTWDEDVCGCVGECREKQCPEGEVWDKAHCDCIKACEKKECGDGFTWSADKCDCVPTGCPPVVCPNDNYLVDEQSCECYCPELPCLQGYLFDKDACACYPEPCEPKECGVREEWNQDLCACVCAFQECATNYYWSYDTCHCECGIDGCEAGYIFDKDQCYCNPDPCSTAPKCDEGLIQNPENCQCYCPDGSPLCGPGCQDTKSQNCGACGNVCRTGCCGGKCC